MIWNKQKTYSKEIRVMKYGGKAASGTEQINSLKT
jgi:hypothetical protein